ncbi:ComF family protein [Thiothrix subterranea]|uniref:ComF family protein n=1 Tax=Thiothrix subterranea TaxID=2735563 RepID=A0AA51MK55_9GAMM|nr:ComF family protein [Thiothrix subterranea]MDQ5769626.1 ComF family protein [Thiothrix subterranea]WML85698.1 ComF family protein [Thiothrix subterranea]
MTIELKGNWKRGFAYDVHTLDSVYMGVDEHGHDSWQTTRSEMGELLYRLKYQGDASVVGQIVDRLGKYKGLETMDAIIPVPSTNKQRKIQPVLAIAQALAKRINVPVLDNVLQKQTGGQELKNVDDPQERQALLKTSLTLNPKANLAGKNILLLDDLYRSGSTLTVATDILYQQAKVKNVFVLVMTKTRSKR